MGWKFTDDYGTTYPALTTSFLDTLVFSDHTISNGDFTGTLDFAATGVALDLLGLMLKVTSLSFTGTVNTDNNTFTLSLQSQGSLGISNIPVIGPYIQSASVTINTVATTTDDLPTTDQFQLQLDIKNGNISGTFITQVPLSNGSFTMTATFENLTVGLNDLDFLLPAGNSFSTYFPSSNPFIQSVYNGSTGLALLEIDLSLYVSNKSGSLSFSVSALGISVGIVNIPVYNKALFINPLAVKVYFYNLPAISLSSSTWTIYGTLALYPLSAQTLPPVGQPDFAFNVAMTIPIAATPFSICGSFDNPNTLPISTMLQDLFGAGTTIGAADDIVITKFDFAADAASKGGAISSFTMDVGLASQFGVFGNSGFGVEEFSMSISYNG